MKQYLSVILFIFLICIGISTSAQGQTTSDRQVDVPVIDQRDQTSQEHRSNDAVTTNRQETSDTNVRTSSHSQQPAAASSTKVAPRATTSPAAARNIDQLPESSIPINYQNSTKQPKEQESLFGRIINNFFRLILVLLIAYIVMLVLKKYANGELVFNGHAPAGSSQARQQRMIRVIESVSLGQGRSVALVAVGKQFLLIGVCGQQMTLLKDVTGEDGLAELAERVANAPGTGSTTFLNTLSRFMPGPVVPTNTAQSSQQMPSPSNQPRQNNYR